LRTGGLVIRHGKCDRRRSVPLNRPERALLREWLAHHANHHSKPRVTSGPVSLLGPASSWSVRSISKIVTAVMARAGIAESPRALRHTVATRLVRDSAHGLVLVADIVGHADTETTRRYPLSDLEQRRARFRGPRRLTAAG
jgi:integrase